MLAAKDIPIIHFVRNSETLGGGKFKHNYRFFIINDENLYNVSGAITAAFGAEVNDRSMVFSTNANQPDDDLKAFNDAMRKFLMLPNLELHDLMNSARQVLEFTIHPDALAFLPPVPLPVAERQGSNNTQGPVELSS